jgi:chromosome segregation ATPase
VLFFSLRAVLRPLHTRLQASLPSCQIVPNGPCEYLQVDSATQTYQQFLHRINARLSEFLPSDAPLGPDNVDTVQSRIEQCNHQEHSALLPLELGGSDLVRRVKMLTSHLRTQGVLGLLGELARADERGVCRALASLVLRAQKLCWVIVRDGDAKARCVDFLRSRNERFGDIPFMPLDGFVRPHNTAPDPRGAPGCIGYAANLIRLPPNLAPDVRTDLEAVVRNACRDALLFETGADAIKHERFILGQRGRTPGGLPRMLSLDGHRLESNGVEFEGGGEDVAMRYSLAQSLPQRLGELQQARKAMLELRVSLVSLSPFLSLASFLFMLCRA